MRDAAANVAVNRPALSTDELIDEIRARGHDFCMAVQAARIAGLKVDLSGANDHVQAHIAHHSHWNFSFEPVDEPGEILRVD